jgi:hypothetical protein
VPELLGADHIDLLDGDISRIYRMSEEGPVTTIVGGGGIFGNHWFAPKLEELGLAAKRLPQLRLVVWGAGWNTHYGLDEVPVPLNLLDQVEIMGVRDSGTSWDWVPCASVLHPRFVDPLPATQSVVVFAHQRSSHLQSAAKEAGFQWRENRGPDVASAIDFLTSGETIITDSYHGAYWGALLGRRVVVVAPFSTKFETLPWPIPVLSAIDLKDAIDRAASFPTAYGESVEANLVFAAKVLGEPSTLAYTLAEAQRPG